MPSLDGAFLNNASESEDSDSDSEMSSEAPPLPPPRMESLRSQDENGYDDEESLVSESDSENDSENESTPPPLPPPRDLDISKPNEYAITVDKFCLYIIGEETISHKQSQFILKFINSYLHKKKN